MPGTANRSGGDRTSVGEDAFPITGPPIPQGLSEEEREVWNIVLQDSPPEQLKRLDSYQLSVLCHCVVQARKLAALCRMDPTDFKASRSYLQVANHICRLSAQFGLSPMDRRRMKLEPPEPQDDAAEWMQQD